MHLEELPFRRLNQHFRNFNRNHRVIVAKDKLCPSLRSMTDLANAPTSSRIKLFSRFLDWKEVVWLFLTPLMFLPLAWFSDTNYRAFKNEGVKARGQIIEIEYSSRNKLVVQFLDPSGNESTTKIELSKSESLKTDITNNVPGSEWLSHEVGDWVEFQYLASNPAKTSLGESRSRTWPVVFLLIGVGSFFLGVFEVRRIFGHATSAHNALQANSVEIATVETVETDRKKAALGKLIWTDSQGARGESRLQKKANFANLDDGDEIKVFRHGDETWWDGDLR